MREPDGARTGVNDLYASSPNRSIAAFSPDCECWFNALDPWTFVDW